MKKINKEMKREIVELFKLYNGKEALEKFNTKYNTNYNYRSLQQIYSNYNLGFTDGIESTATEEQLKHLVKIEQKAKIEQKKAVMLNSENHKMLRAIGSEELLLEKFEEKLNSLSLTRLKPRELKNPNANELVFFKADDHFRGTEEDKQVQRNFYETIHSIAKRKKAKTVSLIFGGDEIEGFLHTNTLKYTPFTPEEQMITFVEETINGVDLLSSEFDVELYLVTSSNHTQTRHLNSNRNTYLKADLSIVMAEMIKTAFRDNVNVKIESAPVFRGREIKGLNGKKVAITHGGLKFEGNINSLVNHYNDSDLILKAHTHVFDIKEVKGVNIITAPTLKTFVTEYEMDNGFVSNKESFDMSDYKWDSEFLELKVDNGDLMVIKRKA